MNRTLNNKSVLHERGMTMNASCIQTIWSAEEKLINQEPLKKSDYRALIQLIHESYGSVLPQRREVNNAQEAEYLRKKSSSEMTACFFESKSQVIEKNYGLSLTAFSL